MAYVGTDPRIYRTCGYHHEVNSEGYLSWYAAPARSLISFSRRNL